MPAYGTRLFLLLSPLRWADGDDDFFYTVEVFDEMENKIDLQVFESFEQASGVYKEFRNLNAI